MYRYVYNKKSITKLHDIVYSSLLHQCSFHGFMAMLHMYYPGQAVAMIRELQDAMQDDAVIYVFK